MFTTISKYIGSAPLTRAERKWRFVFIAFVLYIFINGTGYSLVHAFYSLALWIYNLPMTGFEPKVSTVFRLVLFIVWIGAAALVPLWLARHLGMALSAARGPSGRERNLVQILLRTIIYTVLPIIAAVALIWVGLNSYLNRPTSVWYWVYAVMWTWQIPVAYFIGKGLNWTIEQREKSGQITTVPADVERVEHDAPSHDAMGDTDTGHHA